MPLTAASEAPCVTAKEPKNKPNVSTSMKTHRRVIVIFFPTCYYSCSITNGWNRNPKTHPVKHLFLCNTGVMMHLTGSLPFWLTLSYQNCTHFLFVSEINQLANWPTRRKQVLLRRGDLITMWKGVNKYSVHACMESNLSVFRWMPHTAAALMCTKLRNLKGSFISVSINYRAPCSEVSATTALHRCHGLLQESQQQRAIWGNRH